MTFVALATVLDQISTRVENNVGVLMKRAAFNGAQKIIELTPVDEGTARSNWRVTAGKAATNARKAFAPGSKLGISEQANLQAAVADARASLSRVTSQRAIRQGLYISNPLSYIAELDNGSSAQAPGGFSDRSVQEVLRTARGGISVARRDRF